MTRGVRDARVERLWPEASARSTLTVCRPVVAAVCRARGLEGSTSMRFPKRDLVATGLVAVAGLVYVLWALDVVSSVHVAGS